MVANLPPGLAEDSISTCSSPLEIQETAHRTVHGIENHHRWPKQLKHVLYIVRSKGGTKTERTTIKILDCKNEPVAIRDALNVKLTQHHIIGDASDWSFGYTTIENESS